MAVESMRFTKSLPCFFSFTDQIVVLLYLMRAKIIQIEQVFFGYNMYEWSAYEKAIEKDRRFYVNAGFDVGIDVLHHLLRGLEGFMLLNSKYAEEVTHRKLTESAVLWFRNCMKHFLIDDNRSIGVDGDTASRAMQLRKKLASSKIINPRGLLCDVAEVMAVSNHELAEKYYDFWLNI